MDALGCVVGGCCVLGGERGRGRRLWVAGGDLFYERVTFEGAGEKRWLVATLHVFHTPQRLTAPMLLKRRVKRFPVVKYVHLLYH
ncbi:hypothetical protein NC651_038118 [Populus alba x Populus x berolinensis]|nr:hypothetical protein NC651_038118 [Populus alba x Populus x berolinensis]